MTLKPPEKEGAAYVQERQQQERDGHRGVEVLPEAEYFLLGGHGVETGIDLLLGKPLLRQLAALVV